MVPTCICHMRCDNHTACLLHITVCGFSIPIMHCLFFWGNTPAKGLQKEHGLPNAPLYCMHVCNTWIMTRQVTIQYAANYGRQRGLSLKLTGKSMLCVSAWMIQGGMTCSASAARTRIPLAPGPSQQHHSSCHDQSGTQHGRYTSLSSHLDR